MYELKTNMTEPEPQRTRILLVRARAFMFDVKHMEIYLEGKLYVWNSLSAAFDKM
jgi:hypothetical protein